jgi:succinoglycan biosynthesis protein ExoH
MKMNRVVSQRIALLRTLMIFGVVLLHTPGRVTVDALDFSNVFHVVRAFFQEGVFRVGVPVLSLISGYLLFGANLDQSPFELYKKKTKTLVVPFIAFNIGLAAAVYGFQFLTGHTLWRNLATLSRIDVLDSLFAITASPIDYPLYFLRDMIVVVILSPLIGKLLRHAPIMGGIFIFYFFVNDVDGLLVLRASIPVMVYIGGAAAVYKWNLQALDRFAKPCAVIFLALCASILVFRMQNRFYITAIAPFFLWPAVSLFENNKAGLWLRKSSNYSFFVFCAHAPLLLAGYTFYQTVSAYVPEWMCWLATPAVTIAALMGVHNVASTRIPTVFNFVTGTRAKPVFVERRKAPRSADAPVYSEEYRNSLGNLSNAF